jgi:hypothetical protein
MLHRRDTGVRGGTGTATGSAGCCGAKQINSKQTNSAAPEVLLRHGGSAGGEEGAGATADMLQRVQGKLCFLSGGLWILQQLALALVHNKLCCSSLSRCYCQPLQCTFCSGHCLAVSQHLHSCSSTMLPEHCLPSHLRCYCQPLQCTFCSGQCLAVSQHLHSCAAQRCLSSACPP